jgi:hypothetical protein
MTLWPSYLNFVKPGDIVESCYADNPPLRGHVIAVARNEGAGCRPIVLVTICGSRGEVATWEKWSHVDD